jgi:transposase-like protein
MNTPSTHRYTNPRFPAASISPAVWWYLRCCRSDRDVDERWFARGVIVT